jgi:hypothetical protein
MESTTEGFAMVEAGGFALLTVDVRMMHRQRH